MAGLENHIKGGFYIKLGPVFPVGKFAMVQKNLLIWGPKNLPAPTLSYLPARTGAAMDLGFLIYFGPSFVHHILRAGIDATFISIWINPTRPDSSGTRTNYYYYFVGQKFGPVISVNPVEHLIFDVSYKINANISYHFDQWNYLSDSQYNKYGYNLTYQELNLNIRYRVILVSFQYNFGKLPYNNIDTTRPKQVIETNTFRILIGLKF